MVDLYSSALVASAIVVSGIVSSRAKISSSIIEVMLGIILANVLLLKIEEWLDFIATFGGLTLTFLAGVEVESRLLKSKAKVSSVIGTLAFLVPLIGELLFLTFFTDWSWNAKLASSLALTTTSIAVVYAVLTEYGIMRTQFAKTIVAITFVNDILTIVGISLIEPAFNITTIAFLLTLAALALIVPRLTNLLIARYGEKVVEVELRFIFAMLLLISFFADEAGMHAVFGAFMLGLIFANTLQKHDRVLAKMKTVAFTLLSPAFFIKAGMLISINAVMQNMLLVLMLLLVKMLSKFAGCYMLCRRWLPEAPTFSTLLLSTGLTVGTITATIGRDLGFLTQEQFSITVIAVILSAVVPTIIAKRFVPKNV
ncbi:MAG: cation:proton antiporter [Candidatus Nitrosocaldus sp.]